MVKVVLDSTGSVRPLGPYSAAVAHAGTLHLAGQLGWDFAADSLIEGGVLVETRRALDNMREVLEQVGLDLDALVKVTLYLVDMDDSPEVNRIWEEYFPTDRPVRTAVAVSALPKGASIEIDGLAALE